MGDDAFRKHRQWAAETYGVAGRLDHKVLKASIIRIPGTDYPDRRSKSLERTISMPPKPSWPVGVLPWSRH